MQGKHQEKNKLKQEIKALSTQLKIALPMLVYTMLMHRIKVAVKSRIKLIAKRHKKKLSKFRKPQQKSDIKSRIQITKNTIHNFSPYTSSDDEIMELNYELDQQIPYTVNYNSINYNSFNYNSSYFSKIFYAIFPIYLTKIWHMLKQNFEILAKNIVKSKYRLNTRKL